MRGGGGQKMSVFVHAKGIKAVHVGEGGQKMANFCPRSCWMPPRLKIISLNYFQVDRHQCTYSDQVSFPCAGPDAKASFYKPTSVHRLNDISNLLRQINGKFTFLLLDRIFHYQWQIDHIDKLRKKPVLESKINYLIREFVIATVSGFHIISIVKKKLNY